MIRGCNWCSSRCGWAATGTSATCWATGRRGGHPDDATVWPGHDYGVRPSSTLGLEKRTNPFLRCESLEAFRALKRHWPAFKAEHGLK